MLIQIAIISFFKIANINAGAGTSYLLTASNAIDATIGTSFFVGGTNSLSNIHKNP